MNILLRDFRVWVAVLAMASALPAPAHEGHDHGAPVPLDSSWAPRASARSDDFDLVAVLVADKLVVWLDRGADNAPVRGASIEVESGAWKERATAAADGSYHLPAGALAAPGVHELVFTVEAGSAVDLLPASLLVPAPEAPPARSDNGLLWGLGGLAAVAGLVALARARKGRAAA